MRSVSIVIPASVMRKLRSAARRAGVRLVNTDVAPITRENWRRLQAVAEKQGSTPEQVLNDLMERTSVEKFIDVMRGMAIKPAGHRHRRKR